MLTALEPLSLAGGQLGRPGPDGAAGTDAAMIRVVVSGAEGRMGVTVCEAVSGAPDMELVGRADPLLGTGSAGALGEADVVVDFTTPDVALENVLALRARRASTW